MVLDCFLIKGLTGVDGDDNSMIFKTFDFCLTFFTLGLIADWNNKAVWLWSWLDLYFKDLYF